MTAQNFLISNQEEEKMDHEISDDDSSDFNDYNQIVADLEKNCCQHKQHKKHEPRAKTIKANSKAV